MKKQWIYKGVAAALALCAILALFVLPIMQLHIGVTALVNAELDTKVNAKWIYNFAVHKTTGDNNVDSLLGSSFEGREIWESMDELQGRIITYIISALLCVLIALTIIVLVFALKNEKKSRQHLLVLSSAGLLSAITASAAFASMAAPLLNGTMQFGSLIGLGILGNMVELIKLEAGSAVLVMVIMFTLLLAASAAFMIIDFLDERNAKKRKKSGKKKSVKR